MCLRLFAGLVTAITLLIPAYGMAAGTNIHELLNSHPASHFGSCSHSTVLGMWSTPAL